MKDKETENAIREWSSLFIDRSEPSVKKSLTARQLLTEAQENKAIKKSTLEQRILEQLNREFENLKDNLDSLTVGDRLAVLKQLTTLVQELS